VIDAGANMGLFSALASHLGGIVYAFEPVKEIREKYLEKTAQLNPNINIVPLALSNKNGQVLIKGGLGNSSIIADIQKNGDYNEIVETITLDDWVKQNNIPKVDFIKADIEGAERLMLEGAQWVLKTYAPKLAICTYHLLDDKEVLTKLILQANPNYKIEYAWKKLYAWVEK
jgi:FkbM family methyltransferase